MEEQELEQLRYPIGKFSRPESIKQEDIDSYIKTIEALPNKLIHAVYGMMEEQLDTQYRPEGWTIRQVVHHLADSHLNSYIRFKWALTEDKPTIKAYDEKLWADLPDASSGPIEVSLKLLEALHARWAMVLKNMSEDDLNKTFVHPESGQEVRLDVNVALYAWHCEHHYAHIMEVKKSKGW
ncbi:MAG: putative metal-dependent hydrolase [Cyclobacteriaceae bacterium]